MPKNPYLEIYKQSRGKRFNGAIYKIEDLLGVVLDPADIGTLDKSATPVQVGVAVKKFLSGFELREKCVTKYSFAIPNAKAIDTICKYSPIVEIGAGTGYWAKLIKQAGGVIKAYDSFEWEDIKVGRYFPVLEGSYEKLETVSKDHTLFLCWSPYAEPLAYNCVKSFKGKYLIDVGEGIGGCTGDDAYHKYVAENFEEVEEVEIPRWEGIHDRLTVYKRK